MTALVLLGAAQAFLPAPGGAPACVMRRALTTKWTTCVMQLEESQVRGTGLPLALRAACHQRQPAPARSYRSASDCANTRNPCATPHRRERFSTSFRSGTPRRTANHPIACSALTTS